MPADGILVGDVAQKNRNQGLGMSIYGLCENNNCWCGYATTTTTPQYCGDGICSPYENCAADCETQQPNYIIPLIIVILIATGITYYYKKRK